MILYNHEWKVREHSTNDVGILSEVFRDKTYNLNYATDEISTIVDIGGHIGGFTVKALQKFKNAKCFTFEPMQDNFELLNENTKIYRDRSSIFNLAVCGDRVPTSLLRSNLKFEWGQINSGSNIYDYAEGKTDIPCMHIRELQELTGFIDILKVDCEGGENSIFENIDFTKIKYLFCELHEYGSKIGNDATVDMLLRNGFEILQHNYINSTIQDFIMLRG